MPFRRFLCESPADAGYPFAEWQGFAYTAWAYSHQDDELINSVWVKCEEMNADDWWIPNWILTEADTLEFRRLARLAKCFRESADLPELC